jgi:transposase-like protein
MQDNHHGRMTVRTIAAARHKKVQAVELMLAGNSYDDIARQVGYTHRGSAHRAVRQALHDREVAAIDQLRSQEVERLDALQALIWPLAESGDVHAAASVVRIVEQRVRLLGLNVHSTNGSSGIDSMVAMKATQEAQPLKMSG